jgi:hypothetical protein
MMPFNSSLKANLHQLFQFKMAIRHAKDFWVVHLQIIHCSQQPVCLVQASGLASLSDQAQVIHQRVHKQVAKPR